MAFYVAHVDRSGNELDRAYVSNSGESLSNDINIDSNESNDNSNSNINSLGNSDSNSNSNSFYNTNSSSNSNSNSNTTSSDYIRIKYIDVRNAHRSGYISPGCYKEIPLRSPSVERYESSPHDSDPFSGGSNEESFNSISRVCAPTYYHTESIESESFETQTTQNQQLTINSGISLERLDFVSSGQSPSVAMLDREHKKTVTYEEWLAKKNKQYAEEAAQRRRYEQRYRRALEKRQRLSQQKYEEWLLTKAAEKAKQQTMSGYATPPATLRPEPAQRSRLPPEEVQRRLAEWERRKIAEMERRRKERRQEEQRKREEERYRREMGEKAWRKWVSTAASKPKPVPLNCGLLSLQGTISAIYVNPNEWKSILDDDDGGSANDKNAIAKTKIEKEKADKALAEQEKAEKLKAEKARLEQERAQRELERKQRLEKFRKEKEKKALKEKADKELADKELAEKEKAEKEKKNKAKLRETLRPKTRQKDKDKPKTKFIKSKDKKVATKTTK